jgi:molecular chaperone HscC
MSTPGAGGVIVGIDLGTTNSLVAVLQNGHAVVLPNGLGEHLTPSAVSVDAKGELLVGAPAKARAATHPDRTAVSFKRDMGTDRRTVIGGRTFRPEELSALILAQLKHDAEAALGCPVVEAVITVPAYFGDLQRQATRDAAEIAGLKVERIINEPTAAALAYGLHQRDRELRAVVLDLGGGTFDVTVLEIIEGVVEVQGSAGDARLGGDDFTEALLGWVTKETGQKLAAGGTSEARLREACELAKRRLVREPETRVVVPGIEVPGRAPHDLDVRLDRASAQQAYGPLLQRMRGPITRAIRDAGVALGDIQEVLLVGGATRMPEVAQLATELFGKLPQRTLHPDESVVIGAAVQAALKANDAQVADMVVTDVAPFTLGIATSTKVGSSHIDGLFSPILERGTCIPASRVERYSTMQDRQRELLIQVFQGEHPSCSDNTKLGEFKLKDLPLRPAGETLVDVRLSYDLNGILEVEMNVVGTARKEVLVIERNPGQLTRAQVEAARKALGAIKFHPRESLPNRTALARAEALYVELRGDARMELSRAIVEFEAALQSQDPERIQAVREGLVSLTAILNQSR